jgi:hypothetical protein
MFSISVACGMVFGPAARVFHAFFALLFSAPAELRTFDLSNQYDLPLRLAPNDCHVLKHPSAPAELGSLEEVRKKV